MDQVGCLVVREEVEMKRFARFAVPLATLAALAAAASANWRLH
jgi:hypothetical protein